MRQTASLLLLLALSLPLAAQTDTGEDGEAEAPRWYQIEVLFFRNLAESVQAEENWPLTIQMQMPPVSYLMPEAESPGEVEALAEWAPPAPILPLMEADPLGGIETDMPIQDTMEASTAISEEDLLAGEFDSEELVEDVAPEIPLWRQFQGVPEEETEMAGILATLKRRSDIEVLEYRAWRQPLLADADPIYYRIDAGQQFGLYHELEGYLGIYLKRYLHIDTQLWWGDYALPLLSATLPEGGEDLELVEVASAPPIQAGPEGAEAPAAPEAEAPGADGEQPEVGENPAFSNDLFAPRIVARAAHLNEQRRMRSNEVHYFDHPLIGVLVRITPWEAAPYDEFAGNLED